MRFAALVLWFFCIGAFAQAFPDKPIRVVIPYAPGGGTDNLVRIIAPSVGSTLGQQLVIENAAVSSQGSTILALISVYRGLGGGWQVREGGDVISSDVKAEMARRTNWGKMLEPGWHLPDVASKKEAKP